MVNMFEIEGKVALITGGASGIGFQFAEELLKNGIRGVVLADINQNFGTTASESLTSKFGRGKVVFVETDVSDKSQFENAFETALKHFGNIDILINNAGIMDDRLWEKEIEINVKGTVIGTLLAMEQYLTKHKSDAEGVVVNLSSIAGTDPVPIMPVYAATKYAIIGLTRSYGNQEHYDRSRVRTFAICPGFTNTPLGINLEDRVLNPDYTVEYQKIKNSFVYQEPAHVALHAIDLIRNAPNGSVWMVENKLPPYEFPYIFRRKLHKLMQKI